MLSQLRSLLLVSFTVLPAGGVCGDTLLFLDDYQWHPSAATALHLDAGEYELVPTLNPGGYGQGVSAFFTGGAWDMWFWRVAIWDSANDQTANQLAYFSTLNHGNPSGFDLSGADEAYEAALMGERSAESTAYPGDGPYIFNVATSGTYYFGVLDSDQANNYGEVFATVRQLQQPVPGLGGGAALFAIGFGRRRRRRSSTRLGG